MVKSGKVPMKRLLTEAPRWYHQLLTLFMIRQIVVHEMSPPSGRSVFINRTTVVPLWCHRSPTLAEEVGRQIKASRGTTNLPLTASCAKQLMIGSPSMASCWQSARRPAGDHVTIGTDIYTSCSLLIFSTDCHDATQEAEEERPCLC